MNFVAEIRGMHFRTNDPVNPAPAKLLVEYMAAGYELELVRDRENEYDSNAIAVWIDPSVLVADFAEDENFQLLLNGYGWTMEQLSDSPRLMLGFVGKEFAEHIAPLLDAGQDYEAKFGVNGKGKPQAFIEVFSSEASAAGCRAEV